MAVATVSRLIIAAALLLQIWHLQKNKQIYPPTFFLFSLGAFLMAYDYYRIDRIVTNRILFKIINASLLLCVGICASHH